MALDFNDLGVELKNELFSGGYECLNLFDLIVKPWNMML